MSRRALRWAGGAVVVLASAALLLSTGPIGGTLALFNGETENAGSTFAGGWVGGPASPTATASGYDVALAWTPGTHGPVTGQQLQGVDNGTSSNCTGAAYSLLATMASATTASYTDSNRGNGTNDGDWFCYAIVSTSATVWTAQTAVPALQLGLAATALSTANGGTAGRIDNNDTITLTFNQRTNVGTANILVCVWSSGSIVLGDTTGSCGAAGDAYSLGRITLSGATISANAAANGSQVAVSSSAPWTVTVTVAGMSGITNLSGSPTWTFTPSASVLSNATTDQATACTAARTTCQPTATTGF